MRFHNRAKIEMINDDQSGMVFYFPDYKQSFSVEWGELEKNPYIPICEVHDRNQVLYSGVHKNQHLYFYVFSNRLYACLEEKSMKNGHYDDFSPKITHYDQDAIIERNSFGGFIFSLKGKSIKTIDDFYSYQHKEETIPVQLHPSLSGKHVILAKMHWGDFHFVVSYDKKQQMLHLTKMVVERIQRLPYYDVESVGRNRIEILDKKSGKTNRINIRKVHAQKPYHIFKYKNNVLEAFRHKIGVYEINGDRYYIFMTLKGLCIVKKNPKRALQFKSLLFPFKTNRSIYIIGRMVHHAYKAFGEYDHLYTLNENHQVSTFVRPFKRIKGFKQLGYFKINAQALDLGTHVHYPLFIGNKKGPIHKFSFGRRSKPSFVFRLKRVGKKVIALRSNIYNQATYSVVPNCEMYSINSHIKIKLAHYMSRILYKNKTKKVNLFFEKQASKADESGIRVFEKVKEKKYKNSKNFFILDRHASRYSELKKKYKRDIIERFSFRHYFYLFIADYFVSSDLSNHVINDRIYINSITKKIKEVPLIFLQHGIMFAKPVENPLGKIFYKNYEAYNIHKNVVSSRLEAKEFHKMGYTDKDLWFTGLPTLDYAKMNKDADKIVYMPTYRYWEEGMIYNGEMEQTTYFKSLVKVIRAFEKAGLKDRLVVVSHNKFAEYIYEELTEYRDLLAVNPSEALKIGKVFITDFSSAIYDSIYRGAYPIFYWEDKSYLIDKYGATPPVNEANAPGPVSISLKELVDTTKQAIKSEFVLENEYKEKYEQINTFRDNHNTDRVVEHMKEHCIL
ncbi:CDP-glycerol glycerophosphotransferase family protein (plasmid) [Pontibacillus sp. ALD_SL1]|uniref:CDP-glycerol glycerophosphotransferase family protein n=1 Tax=Pontibacillus sp. ALD_SL1 TaxID=2777185 RepID=UPI001A96A28D|nr:CDP-glycerol glycerophosphotransferase family protein [Pontibacillus sp. ALD_SL1]QST02828.1 CDP-glycerol glycerophosphotransferase family protein [Pontibacillus sp. ALD_SL1]